MVRLKGYNLAPSFADFYAISIPYGAIKRGDILARLDKELYFNSLWCD